MASFLEQLETLLDDAAAADLLSAESRRELMALARERDAGNGAARLIRAVSIIASLALILGIILLISANWDWIDPSHKLTGFFILFLGFHGGGLALRRYAPLTRHGLAEGLNFTGGGLFLAGVALVSQIYNIHENPSNGVLAWLIATLPLALLLKSPSLMVMTIIAGVTWIHLKAFADDQATGLVMSIQLFFPLFLMGCGTALDRLAAALGQVCRITGALWFGAVLYGNGFYRHWYRDLWYENSSPYPLVFLALGAAGCVGIWLGRDGSSRRLDRWLAILLGCSFILGVGMFALSMEWVGHGSAYSVFQFGRYRTFLIVPYILSGLAWLLWFGWCIWLVFEGSAKDRNALVTVGIYGMALGLITRYIDLIGTLADTGIIFITGGIILLVIGWSAEKWRRRLTRKT